MMASTYEKKTRQISNCVIGFGIPTSKNAFFVAQKSKPGCLALADNSVGLGWPPYEHDVVLPLERLQLSYEEWGVKVIHPLKLEDFGDLFRDHSHSIVILFTHWGADVVEFSDRMASIQDTAAQIPEDFAGIIDLCVCHPRALVEELQKRCPKAVVKFIDREATPVFWLHFYLLLFKAMYSEQLSYLQALERVVLLLLHTNTEKGLLKCSR